MKKIVFILMILVIGILFAGCTQQTEQTDRTDRPNRQTEQTDFVKHIQVKNIYPRIDAYMNHYPPYIVTKDGEIYDIHDDMIWAKFDVDKNYTVEYTNCIGIEGKRSGCITNIVGD